MPLARTGSDSRSSFGRRFGSVGCVVIVANALKFIVKSFGVRSTHSYTAYRWGQKWIVLSVLVKFPFAIRPWALPVLVALYRDPEWDQAHGTRHKTPAHFARLLLARVIRWFPERQFIVMGDTGYGTSESARFCSKHAGHLTLVSKFYRDAALYAPPPPRTRGTMGRPRVKGQKLASPQEVVAHTTKRTSLTVSWYGGSTRDIEVVTGTGYWYRIGEDLVAVRWVYVHDCTGTHRDEYLFTTDITMRPQQIVECYTQRWSLETTFQECREYLKLESPTVTFPAPLTSPSKSCRRITSRSRAR